MFMLQKVHMYNCCCYVNEMETSFLTKIPQVFPTAHTDCEMCFFLFAVRKLCRTFTCEKLSGIREPKVRVSNCKSLQPQPLEYQLFHAKLSTLVFGACMFTLARKHKDYCCYQLIRDGDPTPSTACSKYGH